MPEREIVCSDLGIIVGLFDKFCYYIFVEKRVFVENRVIVKNS
jgi:hypothetical protein